MSDEFAIVSFNADSSLSDGQTQDVTDSAITSCTGAIFFAAGTTGTNTDTAHARKSVGFTDGTNDFSFANRSEDAVIDFTESRNEGNSTRCIQMIDTVTNAVVASASADLLSNGIRLTWDTAPDADYEIVAVLFGGTTNLVVGGGTPPSTATSVNVGFRPNAVLFASSSGSLAGASNDYSYGFGAAIDDGTPTQSSIYGRWRDGISSGNPTDADGIVDTDDAGGEVQPGGTYRDISITTFEATGWQWQRSGTLPVAIYLAIEFSEARSVGVAVETLPSGTGNTSFTGLGFRPQVAFGIANLMTASDTQTDGATAGSHSLFAFNADGGYSMSFHEEEGKTVSTGVNTGSRVETNPLFIYNDDGTIGSEASLTSLDGSGFTLNFSTATAGRMVVFGVQQLAIVDVEDETVEVSEDVQTLIGRFGRVDESVEVSEALVAVIGKLGQVDESIEISEDLVTLVTVATVEDQTRRGATLEGGAEVGVTLEGGTPMGTTL